VAIYAEARNIAPFEDWNRIEAGCPEHCQSSNFRARASGNLAMACRHHLALDHKNRIAKARG
jgi:hypothetical protein